MKQIQISLDRTIRDGLHYHNKFVQIFSLVNKYYKVATIEWEKGCMRFTFTAGEQQVEVTIDINDIASRILEMISLDLVMLVGYHVPLKPIAQALVVQLRTISQILADPSTKIYWFEFSSVMGYADDSESTLYEYLKLKRFAGHDDTVHNCMLVLSVFNDLLKMTRTIPTIAFPYENFEPTAITSKLVRQISMESDVYDEVYEFPEDTQRLFEIIEGFCRSMGIHHSQFDRMDFNLSYMREHSLTTCQMIAYQRIREVLCLLTALPLEWTLLEYPALQGE